MLDLTLGPSFKQTWGQILLKVFKCKYFSIFQMQMQILLFSSNANANTFQKYFKYFFKYFQRLKILYISIH